MADYANTLIGFTLIESEYDDAPAELTYFSLNPPSDPKDPTPPVVSFVTSTIIPLGPTDPVVVDVTDNLDELGRVLLAVVVNGGSDTEVVHDGTAFTARYAASTRSAITNGYRYTLRRTGGWPGTSITARVWAVDQDGNLES